MIIVSQDKADIINFDNVKGISVKENNIIAIGQFTVQEESGAYILGKYKTEERAKEVLQNLIQSYREYRTAEVDGYTNVLEETAVYEMPKE